MGFVDKLRGQLIDIIEFLDDSRDTIVWRFPRQGNEIKNQAQLIVREGQVAVFESEGQIADVFGPGRYVLETKNLPILTTLKGWKYGFNSPFKAEVYFVATRQFTDFKWGTQHPITLRDPEFGMVRLRAFGTYALKVSDPAAMLRQLVGTDSNFRTEEIGEFFRQNIIGHLAPAIATSGIAVLDLAAHQQTLSNALAPALSAQLAEYGVTIPRFVIENVSLPPEVEAALDKRTQMGVLGDLDQYTKFQTATAIGDAANNPGGAGEGMGLGMGMAMGTQMARSIQEAQQSAPAGASAGGPPPLPVSDEMWFYAVGATQAGPVTPEDLAQQVGAGAVTRETLVWKQGMAAWTAAGQVPNLASLFAAVPPPLPPTTPPATPPTTPPTEA
jgi:membrane protease subunit (stomatin/prohibitin family)